MPNTSASNRKINTSVDINRIQTAPYKKSSENVVVQTVFVTTSGLIQPETPSQRRPRVERIILK